MGRKRDAGRDVGGVTGVRTDEGRRDDATVEPAQVGTF